MQAPYCSLETRLPDFSWGEGRGREPVISGAGGAEAAVLEAQEGPGLPLSKAEGVLRQRRQGPWMRELGLRGGGSVWSWGWCFPPGRGGGRTHSHEPEVSGGFCRETFTVSLSHSSDTRAWPSSTRQCAGCWASSDDCLPGAHGLGTRPIVPDVL